MISNLIKQNIYLIKNTYNKFSNKYKQNNKQTQTHQTQPMETNNKLDEAQQKKKNLPLAVDPVYLPMSGCLFACLSFIGCLCLFICLSV